MGQAACSLLAQAGLALGSPTALQHCLRCDHSGLPCLAVPRSHHTHVHVAAHHHHNPACMHVVPTNAHSSVALTVHMWSLQAGTEDACAAHGCVSH